MQVEKNKSLKNYNSFGINAKARQFVSVKNIEELKEAVRIIPKEQLFILGGGSNMLLTSNLDYFVVHIDLKGIEIISEDEDTTLLKVMAGENWHEFVLYCIKNNLGGVENLSLIPGNVGTSPIQNIGAYGVELKDTFQSCEVLEISNLKEKTFSLEECGFAYRDSIFKSKNKGEYIITSVTFTLTKRNHQKNTSYGDIQKYLTEVNILEPGIKDISNAVIAIRQSKLPDPKLLGNGGSFFKNPIIDFESFIIFQKEFPEAPFYKNSDSQYKIPAGWLIENAGFKGKRYGDAGVHKNQALVLVNYGEATGGEIWDLALKIQTAVKNKYGIVIEPEVNIF